MLIPDPLAPYAKLIRLGLWCLLAGGLYVAGCQRGEDKAAAKAEARITRANEQLDDARKEAAENLRAANACGELLKEVNRQTQLAIDEAARQQQAAREAARLAEAAAVQSQRRAIQAEQALQAAKTQPGCRQQLEQNLCDAIPLL